MKPKRNSICKNYLKTNHIMHDCYVWSPQSTLNSCAIEISAKKRKVRKTFTMLETYLDGMTPEFIFICDLSKKDDILLIYAINYKIGEDEDNNMAKLQFILINLALFVSKWNIKVDLNPIAVLKDGTQITKNGILLASILN